MEELPDPELVDSTYPKKSKAQKKFLSYPLDLVMEKTLESTIQFCSNSVKMELRELPWHSRNQQLFPTLRH